MALRTDVVNATIALIDQLKKVNLPGGAAGGYLEAVVSYQGDLDPQPDDEDLLELIGGRDPAVLVTTGDSGTYEDETMGYRRQGQLAFTVEILVVSGNKRSDEAKHDGDGFSTDPGIFDIMEAVRDAVWAIDLSVSGAGKLSPVSELAVVRSGARAIWRMTFAIDTDVQAADPDAAADSYTSIQVDANDAAGSGDADPVSQHRTTI